MKKQNRYLLFLTGISILLGSCSKENDNNPAEKVPVIINAGINTRAVDNEWEAGDAIGVTMYKSDKETCMDGCFNIQYNNQNNGTQFSPISGAVSLYFPEDGSNVTFKSYYPYKESLNNDFLYPISLENQEVLPAIDFMTAEHLSGSSRMSPAVRMQFYHRLTKVKFVMKFLDENPAGYKDFNLTVKGMKTAGTYDIENECLSIDGNSYNDIFLPLRDEHIESEEENKRVGIVFPRPEGSGVTVELTTAAGARYTGPMDPELELKEGYKYLIKIYISGDGGSGGEGPDPGDGEPLQLEVISIEPWADGGDHILEAN